MRRAALITVGLVLAGCSAGGERDKADMAPTTAVTQAGGPLDAAAASTVPGATAPVDGAPGAPGSSGTTSISNSTNGAPGAPGGSAAAAGSPGVGTGTGSGGGSTGATGGESGTGSGTGSGTPGISSGESSTGTPTTAGGSDGTSSPPPTIYATEEECAALRQILAVIDHPELRQLAVQANCV